MKARINKWNDQPQNSLNQILLKLDVKNVFNQVDKLGFFESVQETLPRRLNWVNCCERSLLGSIPVKINSVRLPVQVEDHFGSGLYSFPGFLCFNSRMSPEQVWSEPGLVSSEEIHVVVIRHPKCDFLSYCSPETIFFDTRHSISSGT